MRDGAYTIKPVASDNSINVFCDMRQGGWTIIQKRQDGTTSFFKEWSEYKQGFGGKTDKNATYVGMESL